jgi:hypothetical protein
MLRSARSIWHKTSWKLGPKDKSASPLQDKEYKISNKKGIFNKNLDQNSVSRKTKPPSPPPIPSFF